MKRVWLKLWIAVLIGIGAAFATYRVLLHQALPGISREQFLAEVRAGHVNRVVIQDEQLITSASSTRGAFTTPYHKSRDAQLVLELRARGIEVVFETSAPGLI